MIRHRSGNDDGVQVAAVEKLLRLRYAFDIWIKRADMVQARRIDVADRFEPAIRKTSEVADQKRSPITASDHADGDLFFHIFRADSFKLVKSLSSVERRLLPC
jgi:hypothetical protein